jgi:hypothetical protein
MWKTISTGEDAESGQTWCGWHPRNEQGIEEVIMSPNWNEPTYAQQFAGNLRGSSEPVPARLNTSIRMMPPEMVQEIQKLDHRSSGAPLYVFVRRDGLPLHPSLQATGLHYFEW